MQSIGIRLKQRWWDLSAAALLLVALVSVALRLNATRWTGYLYITESLVFLGACLGFALGYSRFSTWFISILSILYSIILVPWQVGQIVGNPTPGLQWPDRLLIVQTRVETVILQLINRDVVEDSVLFIVLMGFLFFWLGVIAGFILIRKGNPWQATVPAGVILVVIQTFDPMSSNRIWYLAAFIFFVLMLVSRMVFLHNRFRWFGTNTSLPPSLGLDFIRFTLVTTGCIVLLAWVLPSITSSLPAFQKIISPIKEELTDFQERFDNAFASLKSTLNVSTDYFGPTLTLGQGNERTDEVVFWIQPPETIPNGLRLYWRAKIYDTFDGAKWMIPDHESQPWDPETGKLDLPVYKQRWSAKFEFVSSSYFTSIISPGQATWVDRDGEIDFMSNPDNTIDLYSFQAEPLVRPGQAYDVQASISQATIYELQRSGVEYPDWIEERYLQLSPTTTQRTIDLAQNITSGLVNPLDQTLAIINFLRDNMTYVETIPPPPSNQDAVDWFLFDYQKGFCNYYASAAVVLLRSLGIPSRFVVGYSTGESLENGQLLVRQKEAHAWPEVFFPNLGWVEFEPTASLPDIERLAGDNSDTSGGNPNTGIDRFRVPTPMMEDESLLEKNLDSSRNRNNSSFSPIQVILIFIIPVVIFSILFILYLKSKGRIKIGAFPVALEAGFNRIGIRPPTVVREWSFLSTLSPMVKSYNEINKALGRLGKLPTQNTTPYERAAILGDILPAARKPVNTLITEYQLSTYSMRPADQLLAYEAGLEIRVLSQKAAQTNFLDRLRLFGPKKIDNRPND
jgi:transglutaminase-like putative cysteine protease